MKKIIALFLIFTASICSAFQGDIQFEKTKSGTTEKLILSQWHINKIGVPSFHYIYTQKKSSCTFTLSGVAEAGFNLDENKKVELDIYNPEDENGKATDPILLFYDKGINFYLSPKESKHKKFAYIGSEKDISSKQKICDGSEKIDTLFKN